jgi:hypothetical protein
MIRFGPILALTVVVVACSSPSGPPTAPSSSTATQAPPSPPATDDDGMIKGTVHDTAGRPLAGARVQVLTGSHAGTTATVAGNGEFSMAGTFDDGTRFRATLDGYISADEMLLPSCAPCHPHKWVNFYLDVPEHPVSIAGDYTLTLIADRSCTSIPAEFRTRVYPVTLVSNASRPENWFDMAFRDGDFEDKAAWVAVAGNFVSIVFSDPGIIEEIAPLTYLSYYAGASATVPASPVTTISAPLDGQIDYCVLSSEPGDYYHCTPTATHAQCKSTNHQLILTRR